MRGLRRVIPLAALAALALTFMASAAPGTVVRNTPCGRVHVTSDSTPRLSVVGNHIQDSAGNVFIPYGISLVGGPETTYWAQSERAAAAQIVASQRYWHANTVRIQVSEAQLLDKPTPGHAYNVPFAASVNRLVCLVLRQGQIPVINDTTLFTAKSRGPTDRSVKFWKFMSKRYGNRFPVIFDLFDEPRLGRNPRTNHFFSHARVWKLWDHGGAIAGKRYLGLQQLVNTVRISERVDNVLWVEEPWFLEPDKLLTGQLPQHLLHGRDIVYAFHKATLSPTAPSFRALEAVARKGIPLVDSEWSQFAATGRPWECQDNAYKGVPRFLALLHQSSIGLMAWSLQPGALVKAPRGVDNVHDGNDFRFTTDPAKLATPNVIRPNYGCNSASLGQGAGTLVQQYFRQYSERAQASLFPKFG
jgi:hypothetical protein